MGPNWTHAEGVILGVTIVGPVMVYGVSASVVYGFDLLCPICYDFVRW